MRRSLTVTPENDKKILLTKGLFLTGETPFDIDYTTMVNIFIDLGYKLMSAAWKDASNQNVVVDKKEIIESFKKYFFDDELKEEAVGDQVAEIIFKKLVEQSGLATTPKLEQNPAPALPAEEPSVSNKKMQKYVA